MVLHEYVVQAYDDENNTIETEATFLNRDDAINYVEQNHFRAKRDTARGNGTLWIEDNNTTYYIEDWILTVDPNCIDVKGLDVNDKD